MILICKAHNNPLKANCTRKDSSTMYLLGSKEFDGEDIEDKFREFEMKNTRMVLKTSAKARYH